MKNNELRIQVEELKGPERITSIAEKKLGMSVARSNIYVKAAAKGN
jgi:cell division protein FtsL